MGFMGKRSILKSKTIEKVWLNKKDYKFLDFEFKITKEEEGWNWGGMSKSCKISVYNCGTLILKLDVCEKDNTKDKERFSFEVVFFNPQTDNDCYSINHIIAVCSKSSMKRHIDMGNAEIIKNQFIFRKKTAYYSYVKIWVRGDILKDNYNKLLSYEFATDEYMSYIKSIFEIKKMQKRTIKKEFKGFLDKIILLNKMKEKDG